MVDLTAERRSSDTDFQFAAMRDKSMLVARVEVDKFLFPGIIEFSPMSFCWVMGGRQRVAAGGGPPGARGSWISCNKNLINKKAQT